MASSSSYVPSPISSRPSSTILSPPAPGPSQPRARFRSSSNPISPSPQHQFHYPSRYRSTTVSGTSLFQPYQPAPSAPPPPIKSPLSQQAMPSEYQLWRRWSSHSQRTAREVLDFDVANSMCDVCGDVASWDVKEESDARTNRNSMAIVCQTCGFIPAETELEEERGRGRTSWRTSGMSIPEFSTGFDDVDSISPSPSRSSIDADTLTPDLLQGITDRDFAAVAAIGRKHRPRPINTAKAQEQRDRDVLSPLPPPLSPFSTPVSPGVGGSNRFVRGVRRLSGVGDAERKRRNRVSIQSVQQSLYEPPPPPKKWFERTEAASFQLKIGPRSQLSAPAKSASRPTIANASSQAAPAIDLKDIVSNPEAFQRLLVTALFTLQEVPEKAGDVKMLDLGLVKERRSGARHYAVRHGKAAPGEVGAGGGGAIPPADEHGRMTVPEKKESSRVKGGGEAKMVRWRVSLR